MFYQLGFENSLSKGGGHKKPSVNNLLSFGFRYEEILKNVFANREEIRKEYLKVEKKLKENTLKKYYQNQCHEQIQLTCSEERVEKVSFVM